MDFSLVFLRFNLLYSCHALLFTISSYHNMHTQARQMSRRLITHPFGTPSHYGNPSILFGKNW
uniref:Uncharacterized protein n=1 Tax=Anguilla anguilla TaxID=7936 RepID=A0A0E9PGL5_ANGAN